MYFYSSLGWEKCPHNQRGTRSTVFFRHFLVAPRAEKINMVGHLWPIHGIGAHHHTPVRKHCPDDHNGLCRPRNLCSCSSVGSPHADNIQRCPRGTYCLVIVFTTCSLQETLGGTGSVQSWLAFLCSGLPLCKASTLQVSFLSVGTEHSP